jgi:hypothetical protein
MPSNRRLGLPCPVRRLCISKQGARMIKVTILQQEMACLVGTDWTNSTLFYPGQASRRGGVGFEKGCSDVQHSRSKQVDSERRASCFYAYVLRRCSVCRMSDIKMNFFTVPTVTAFVACLALPPAQPLIRGGQWPFLLPAHNFARFSATPLATAPLIK